ncbi:MAG: hypothetical protein WC553_03110 [Patescibacteria group bacterium]|jgi:hypothetical protein
MANKRGSIPAELQGVAYEEDVNAIQEQVEKCYSKDRYEEFLEAVEKIIGRYLKANVGWVIVVWLITIIGGMLAQKFLNILGSTPTK